MRRLSPLAIGLAISLAMAACSKSNEEAKAPEAPPAEPAAAAAAPTADSAAIDAAVASADRTAEDKERDARSRPAEVLTFMELRPGQHALDYFAAARLLHRADVARRRPERQSHRVQQSRVPEVLAKTGRPSATATTGCRTSRK